MIKLARKSLITLNITVIICTVLAILSPFINPEIIHLPAFLGLFFPFLLLANVLFIILWLSFKKTYALFSLACLLCSYPRAKKIFQYHKAYIPVLDSSETLRVASYNIRNLSALYSAETKSISKKELDLFVESLLDPLAPDVLCIQEGNRMINDIAEMLRIQHIFKIPQSRTYILSKFPITDSGKLEFKDDGSLCGWVDLEHSKGKVRIYNLHLKSNKITDKTQRMLEDVDISTKKTWQDVSTILSRYGETTKSRAKQAEQIAAHIQNSPYPVIVCGDFNDVAQSYAYQIIQKGLKDSFIEHGIGLGVTYAEGIPWLRIDYILSSSHFEMLSHEVKNAPFSDHYPIFARVRIH